LHQFTEMLFSAQCCDRRETLPRYRKLVQFYSLSQNFWGPPPQKGGAKNMPNLGRFRTTSKFDREYLRNE